MADPIRIRRRVTGGAAGAPASLIHAELAYNEVDDVLYYGKGAGAGNPPTALSIVTVGGLGAYANLTSSQTISGVKTFSASPLVPTAANASNDTTAASTAYVHNYAQPLTAGLSALAALVTTGFVVATAAGVYASRSVAGTATRITVTNGDGIAGNPTIDLAASGVTAGTYTKITVDTFGRATVGAQMNNADVVSSLGFTPENILNKGVANGYAPLDATGKVALAFLPASATGGLSYQGTWNASTNTPALANGTGTNGQYYKVATAGNTTINGNTNWTIGDLIVYNGTAWDKFEGGQPDVVSVAGRIGAITLTTADIGGLGTVATLNTIPVINGGTGATTLTGYVKGAGTAVMTASATIPNTDITGLGTLSTQNANAVAITGGTVAGSTVTGNIAGSAANVTGIVAVANGGTGAITLTGYVKGTGTTAMTSSSTIPVGDISGLGAMSLQNATAVAITGGTIDNVVIDGGTF
jgi:hypothetical protein